MQAALDLAESDIQVYLLEKSPWIGGRMAQLDKTFPTNDCAMCIMSPRLVECSRHHNIQIISNADLVKLSGEAGAFTASIRKRARYVDESKCTGCGICTQKCPWRTDSEFDGGLRKRKAIYTPFAQAVPNVPFIDRELCMYFRRGTCKACEMFCGPKAIAFDQQDQHFDLEVGAVILAPGSDTYDAGLSQEFGFGRYPNVVTSLQFERLLSAAGPTQGHIQRTSDAAEPKRIAWLQCIGSRDQERPYCSAVCCMYATKEAILAREHLSSDTGLSIFLMDLRAFGKGFDAYFQRAQSHGIRYVHCRASALKEVPSSKNLEFQYENEAGELLTEEFDMVVLSVGLAAPKGAAELAAVAGVNLDKFGFGAGSPLSPLEAARPGVYLCGAFRGPKDIPDSVTEASGAAGEVQRLLAPVRGTLAKPKEFPPELPMLSTEEPRVGVFVCHCGTNIAGVVDVAEVTRFASELPHVVYADHVMFACSTDSLKAMREAIAEHRLNRVVMASCSPRTHEGLFQENVREAGLNAYLYEMANIRDQCSWVHGDVPDEATVKSKMLVAMAVSRASHLEPLYQLPQGLSDRALVVGGGVAGITAALSLAEQGFPVALVEREPHLGGMLLEHDTLTSGLDSRELVSQLVEQVQANDRIEVLTNHQVVKSIGFVGNFKTIIASRDDPTQRLIEHGVTIIATGGREYRGNEYLLGQHPAALTMGDLEKAIKANDPRLSQAKRLVIVQCVGPWHEQPFYCSRVCCTVTMKNILKLKKLNPSCQIFVLYKDIRTYGAREEMYTAARQAGAIFVRYSDDNLPVAQAAGNAIKVSFTEPSLKERITITADLLVSSTAMVPSKGAEELSKAFKIPQTQEGFFQEAHPKLRPVDFASDGAFLCGVAHYPKSVEEAMIQGKAAAARASRVISKDELMVGGVVASVDGEKCTACLTCVRICPYNVPVIRDGVAVIEAAACQGCGICAAECPAKAIQLHHYRDDQVIMKIKGMAELIEAGGVPV
ncbi:MAG: CoB--CoM heterodisulfide reductase iron-sulfur subunit A family protein [Chloroflexi bacterium]|nr:CoB--CoM heterodisulfide reductase iron-sulfur subunit A family protein [Chloroflexota bacterium]